ncbi:hypothetical protein [Limibacillus sp. MBR-115]|jgi:hypothetical protein|uniref:hypothetical protein n=1 Tax=Limibacillus sp. MBR-115 TaxID=3156465 RepID=UPI00339485F1
MPVGSRKNKAVFGNRGALSVLFKRSLIAGSLLLPAVVQPALAELAHYDCTWTGRVGQPFSMTYADGTTYIEGSLGVFGQIAPTEKTETTYRAALELPGGVFAIEWPKNGGAARVAVINLKDEIQGGHPQAAQCTLSE